MNILEICGLLDKNEAGVYSLRTSQTMKSGTYSRDGLLNDDQLQTNYFQKVKVKYINDLTSAPKNKVWWLGIGHNKIYAPAKYNPSTQFDDFITGVPSLDNNAKVGLAAYLKRMKEIAKLVMTEDYSAAFSMNIHDNTCSELHNDVTINNHISENGLNIVRSLSTSISTSDIKPGVEKKVNEFISVVPND